MVSSVDVAKLAGVSQATVSRVMNNPDKVNAATIEKVNAAIQQLNYRPNAAARSLISRRSGMLAVVCGPLDDPETAEFAGKSIAYAQKKGFIAEMHIQDPHNPGAVFETMVNTQADGILAGPLIAVGTGMELLKSSGIPFVFSGMGDPETDNAVSMDNYAAGRMAAEHVSSFNHKTVGWLGGHQDEPHHRERYRGFLEQMQKQEANILNASGDLAEFDAIFSAMMARRDRPSAIVAATDALGAYAIDFLVDYGYSIPQDIIVVGIGNSKQSAMNPLSLTSVGLPAERDIHKEAVGRLTAMIAGNSEEADQSPAVMPRLYQRKSSTLQKL